VSKVDQRPLFEKYRVERIAPSTRGIAHDACDYFVLDLTHDPIARIAIAAYAEAARFTHPALARDLRIKLQQPIAGVEYPYA